MSNTMDEGPRDRDDDEVVATDDESMFDVKPMPIAAAAIGLISEAQKRDALKLIREEDPEKFNTWKNNREEIDLSGADLSGLDLSGFDLSGVNLDGADLSGAILVNVKGLRADMLSQCILFDITVDRNSEGILNAATTLVRKSWKRSGSEENY
ncbi:pentapeptide repeat-containing protein [Patescibacteria group bacterium]